MLRLFDLLPDVLFFIKDTQCRYTHVNQTLTQRLGIKRREDILGKSVLELYPPTPLTDAQLEIAVEVVVRLVLSALTRPSKSPSAAADDIAWIVGLALAGANC